MSRLPERLETPRLVLRVPRPADAPALNAAVVESFQELTLWMPGGGAAKRGRYRDVLRGRAGKLEQ